MPFLSDGNSNSTGQFPSNQSGTDYNSLTFPALGNRDITVKDASTWESQVGFNVGLGLGFVREETDTDDDTNRERDTTQEIDWEDTICEERELLDATCRDLLKCTITNLNIRDKGTLVHSDMQKLREQADKAWNLACRIPEDLKDELDDRIDEIICDWERRRCRALLQYQRAAGSSLNSLVQQWTTQDLRELEKAIAQVAAEHNIETHRLRTDALRDAFSMNTTACMEFNDRNVRRAIGMWQVLRGSLDEFKRDQVHDEIQVTDDDEVIDRNIRVDRDKLNTQFESQFNWYQNVTDVSDTSGTYIPQMDGLIGQFQAGLTPPVAPPFP